MSPLLRRTLASVAAWTAGAVVAVSVGILALSAIGDGWASGAPQSQRPDAMGQIGVSSPVPSSASRPAEGGTVSAGKRRLVPGRGGSADVQCYGADAYLVVWYPQQGFQVDDVHRGPARVASVKFSSPGGDYVLAVRCVDGIPQADSNWQHDGTGEHD